MRRQSPVNISASNDNSDLYTKFSQRKNFIGYFFKNIRIYPEALLSHKGLAA